MGRSRRTETSFRHEQFVPSQLVQQSRSFWRPTRREFLHVGAIGGLGLTLGDYSASRPGRPARAKAAAAKAVIHIFLPGGMAHQEIVRPQAARPDRIPRRDGHGQDQARRRCTSTSCMKKTAEIADKITVMPLDDPRRGGPRARHAQHVHRLPAQPGAAVPEHGQRRRHEFGVAQQPAAVRLRPDACRTTTPARGYLGSALTPRSASAATRPTAVSGAGPEPARRRRRDALRRRAASMLDAVERPLRAEEKSDELDGDGHVLPAGLRLISSREGPRGVQHQRRAGRKLRDEYGRNAAGQRMLMARRLVEAGVRFVSLTYGGWDITPTSRTAMTSQMPPFDQAFAALISDLDQRGLLDTTLVMVSSEFGRTPKINGDRRPRPLAEGVQRRRWPAAASRRVMSTARPTPTGSEPDSDPLTVEDLAPHGLPPAGHRRRQEADGPRQPAHRRSSTMARCARN